MRHDGEIAASGKLLRTDDYNVEVNTKWRRAHAKIPGRKKILDK
jgi:hypothetical protein